MSKKKLTFVCQECGYESPKWMGRCPGCQTWNSMVEERIHSVPWAAGKGMASISKNESPVPITQIKAEEAPRLPTGVGEFDRVLGGGVVPGSLVLFGGDPGIGKSTLLLQISGILSEQGHRVLYVSGEESLKQIKMRADRLGIESAELFILTETHIDEIERQIDQAEPKVVILDSIQTVYHPEVSSTPGSVAQVRECTAVLMRVAKSKGIAIFVVGHVTKEGAIAGPKILEHMVDAVIYFEGERHHTYRILRAVKNRFGSTNEIGIFDMQESGLVEVVNPSELFLEERAHGAAGSIVVASMEGTRPVLVELQALVTPTSFGTPRRTATGVDHHRVSLIMAVLEKRVGLLLQNQDAYINVAGGVKLNEPALDLGMAISIASSFREKPTSPYDVVIGEVGLTGEVRGVSRIEQRLTEARKLGFKRAIIPYKNTLGWELPEGIEVIGVQSVQEAIQVVLEGETR
ncbi:DNA repair protein RadA [Caldalkalibacillus thermarum TA2.A1]|uniref:DNA repair protein RadA n=2 Tax=Caldalkalibacillus thermarum (strain TA2.A1) TaxID=986075 RepID=A0A8X8IB50_CALTT|nr:DNA repair protein RadA [Caldalkalibacillus thermarum]QZT34391.1 DNA repair protein RadA [Caldalkalibacillus thermarum TA2.A1]